MNEYFWLVYDHNWTVGSISPQESQGKSALGQYDILILIISLVRDDEWILEEKWVNRSFSRRDEKENYTIDVSFYHSRI